MLNLVKSKFHIENSKHEPFYLNQSKLKEKNNEHKRESKISRKKC